MDLNEIICFVRVAQQRSITKAAKSLGVPKSTVSRRVSSLEERLATTLLIRTTRKVQLTDVGEQYYARMAAALTAIEHAEGDLQAKQERIAGVIRVTAPVEFGVGSFMTVMTSFQKRYPEVSLELLLTERVVDIVGEGIDLALRIGALADSSLIAKRIGTITGKLTASAGYLAEHGTPKTLEDLEDATRHRLLGFAPNGWHLAWTLRKGTTRRTLKATSRLVSNNILALKTAALAHQGIAVLPTFMTQDEIATKKLVPVLSDWNAFGSPIHLVYPGQRFIAPKVRALIEVLSAELVFSD